MKVTVCLNQKLVRTVPTIDINECGANMTDCDQVCVNTNGSYHCDCNNGYTLSEDNTTCEGA